MKVVTVRQPFASLIAVGAKTLLDQAREHYTRWWRSWSTNPRMGGNIMSEIVKEVWAIAVSRGGKPDRILTRYDEERGGRVMESVLFFPGQSGYDARREVGPMSDFERRTDARERLIIGMAEVARNHIGRFDKGHWACDCGHASGHDVDSYARHINAEVLTWQLSPEARPYLLLAESLGPDDDNTGLRTLEWEA